MSKSIATIFRLSEKENEKLKRDAAKVRMTEAHFIRCLLSGYHPPAAPDDRFFDDMEQITDVSDKLANSIKLARTEEDWKAIREEVAGLKNLRFALMQKYLRGKRADK